MKLRGVVLLIGPVLLPFCTPSFAMPGLAVAVQGSNAVVSWPSATGETYALLYRPTFRPGDRWIVLATDIPAALGTNRTEFVHSNIIQFPEIPTGEGTNDGGTPFPPGYSSGTDAAVDYEPYALDESTIQYLASRKVYPPYIWDLQHRAPYIWELEQRPPYPWESEAWLRYLGALQDGSWFAAKEKLLAMHAAGTLTMEASSDAGEPLTVTNTGFYQVKGVRIMGGLTNGMTAPRYLTIPIAVEEDAIYVRLLANGETFPDYDYSFLNPPYATNVAFFEMDTARLSNGGPYTIQVEAAWRVPNPDGGGLAKARTQAFTIDASNAISFPEWEDDTADDVASFYIQSSLPAVDWQIDIYNYWEYWDWYNGVIPDVSPIKALSGSTTDGRIVYHWNLVDDSGQLRTNVNEDPLFISFTTVWPPGERLLEAATGTTAANPTQRQGAPWPDEGGHWTVSYQDMFRHYYDQEDLMISMVNAWAGIAFLPDADPFIFVPSTEPTNAQTFPIRFNYWPGHRLYSTNDIMVLMPLQDESLLISCLTDPRSRNFYYFGHGDQQTIARVTTPGMLRSYGLRHRYRFVWLDGCESGAGGWDKAFGINGPGVFTLPYYRERSKRPAAFVGNRYSIPLGIPGIREINGVRYDGLIPDAVPYFRTQFTFYWFFGYAGLGGSITQARDTIPDAGMQYPDGPKAKQRYQPGDDLYISGYDDLGYDEYNQKSDIPRP